MGAGHIAQSIDERLTPLFVIPGTTLGLSRPSGRGYTPAEMAKINTNIDAEAAKSTFNPLVGIRERAAEMEAADAAREVAEAEERKKPRKTLKEKMGIQIPKRRGWRDEEQKKDAE